MTLAHPGANPFDATARTETPPSVKTAFDCDILTLARDTHAHAEAAARKAAVAPDPMDDLYKPLGNKDVACVLQVQGR